MDVAKYVLAGARALPVCRSRWRWRSNRALLTPLTVKITGWTLQRERRLRQTDILGVRMTRMESWMRAYCAHRSASGEAVRAGAASFRPSPASVCWRRVTLTGALRRVMQLLCGHRRKGTGDGVAG